MTQQQVNRILIVITLLIGAISCNRHREIVLYVSNNSQFTKENTIKVYFNDSLLLSQKFRYTDIVPHDDIFRFKLKESTGVLKIIELAYGIEKMENININREKYVFVGFNEFKNNLPPGDSIKREISILKRKEYTNLY